jgi:hypothetical protein
VYIASQVGTEIRQGEIISSLTQYEFDPESGDLIDVPVALAVVASQDCDLLRDHEAWTKESSSSLTNILLFPAVECAVAKGTLGGSDIWKIAKQNKNERYHVLQSVTVETDLQSIGIPDLFVDFRQLLTLTPRQLRWQLDSGVAHRRCRMKPPYGEHFQTRATQYLGRIGLDPPHQIV